MTHCRYSVCPRPGHDADPAAVSAGHPPHPPHQQPRQEDRPWHQVRIHIYITSISTGITTSISTPLSSCISTCISMGVFSVSTCILYLTSISTSVSTSISTYIYVYISRCEAGVGECCGSLLPGHPVQVCRYNATEWEVSSLVTPTLLNITAHRWIVDNLSMYHFTSSLSQQREEQSTKTAAT